MAAKPKAERPRSKRAKQGHLPTMEPPSIPEIEAAAAEYVEARDERQALTKREIEKKTILMHLMKEHGLSVYDFDNLRVIIDARENVKVNVRKADEESNGEQEEE